MNVLVVVVVVITGVQTGELPHVLLHQQIRYDVYCHDVARRVTVV